MGETTNFGDFIKMKRKERNLGVNQLAAFSGVSAAQISRIESGKRFSPRPETIQKLSDALKVDYEVLMNKAGYLNGDPSVKKSKDKINTAFHDFDNLTEEEKEYLETQLEIFRKIKDKKKK